MGRIYLLRWRRGDVDGVEVLGFMTKRHYSAESEGEGVIACSRGGILDGLTEFPDLHLVALENVREWSAFQLFREGFRRPRVWYGRQFKLGDSCLVDRARDLGLWSLLHPTL